MKLKIGYDVNLGFPNDFAEWIDVDITAYHDISVMLKDFEMDIISGMFIPAGALPYIKNYQIISQALFGTTNRMTLKSILVSAPNAPAGDFSKQMPMGRINQYCTTSFWAPLIYMRSCFPFKTQLIFQETDSYQNLLHLTAEGIINSAMVWDIILEENPQDTRRVRQSIYQRHLPTPIIVVKNECDASLQVKINQFKSSDPKAFFTGFQTPHLSHLNQFINSMKYAKEHFEIIVRS